VLIVDDLSNGFNDAILVESCQHSRRDDAALVAEDCPAEVHQLPEDDEADDARDHVDDSDCQ